MGQYQQWLQYREIDRHLQAQLEELHHELAQLQERSSIYMHMMPPAEDGPWNQKNAILQALQSSLNGAISTNGHATEEQFGAFQPPLEVVSLAPQPTREEEPGNSISAVLFAQSSLPNFETPTAQQPVPTGDMAQFTSYLDQQLPPSLPHFEIDLLPEDMATFFDQHTSTDPQMELPWWLRTNANNRNNSEPIDQESVRTNRLVERWLERWGKLPPHLQKPGGNQS